METGGADGQQSRSSHRRSDPREPPGRGVGPGALPGSGIDTNWVISEVSLQAGGLEGVKNPRAQANLSNGKGIDHLGANEALGAVIGANLVAAQALCAP